MLAKYDFIFHHSSSKILHKLIKHVTRSKYHHVSLVLDNNHTLDINYKNPLRIKHFSYSTGNFDVYRLSHLSKIQKVNFVNFIQETLNSKYDLREIINYFGFGINDKNDMWICISWIDELLEQSGVEIIKDIKVHKFEDLINKYEMTKVI